MNASVVGSGYVGITLAACLADLGHEVTLVADAATVDRLEAGEVPVAEPGLDPLVAAYAGSRLRATTDHAAVADADLTLLAVEAPVEEDGTVDAGDLVSAAEAVGRAVAGRDRYHLLVVASAVLPDVVESALVPAFEAAAGEADGEGVGVAVSPAFLREGSAVDDFMDPGEIVVGTDGDDRALDLLAELYEPLVTDWDVPTVATGRREAAMIEYVDSAFRAATASLVDDLGNVCAAFDVDAHEVADAVGMDGGAGDRPLRAGVGWGGRRLTGDTATLLAAAREAGYDPVMLEAALEVNDRQPERLLALLDEHVDVEGRRVAVLGLAVEPGTGDVRGSRAKPVVEGLRERGADVVAYDPVAAEAMAAEYPDVEYADSAAGALEGAHGAVVVTGWPEFADLDEAFDAMADPVVVDGRRVVRRREDITYEGLAW